MIRCCAAHQPAFYGTWAFLEANSLKTYLKSVAGPRTRASTPKMITTSTYQSHPLPSRDCPTQHWYRTFAHNELPVAY